MDVIKVEIKEIWKSMDDKRKIKYINWTMLLLIGFSLVFLMLSFPLRIITPFDLPPSWYQSSPLISGIIAVLLIGVSISFMLISVYLYFISKEIMNRLLEMSDDE